MVPLVFLINGLTKHDWLEALLFAVAVAVGLTPEMLPMIVTVNLAKGAIAMSRAQGHRQAPQRDSELRRDGRAVHRQDRHADAGPDHSRSVIVDIRGEESERVLQYAYLNSHFQSGLQEPARSSPCSSTSSCTAMLSIDQGYAQDRRDSVRFRAPASCRWSCRTGRTSTS